MKIWMNKVTPTTDYIAPHFIILILHSGCHLLDISFKTQEGHCEIITILLYLHGRIRIMNVMEHL